MVKPLCCIVSALGHHATPCTPLKKGLPAFNFLIITRVPREIHGTQSGQKSVKTIVVCTHILVPCDRICFVHIKYNFKGQ